MIDLAIQLDSNVDLPLYEQIYLHIKKDIKEGRLVKDMRLPSSRRLSESLKVSRSTVDNAYMQLVAEGYVNAVPCKGYFVADISLLLDNVNNGQVNLDKIIKKENKPSVIDFNTSGIDLSAFPFGTWRRITKNVLSADNSDLFRLGDAKGDKTFRESIQRYLYEARGVEASVEQIIVGAGSDYLLMLLCNIFGKMQVAVENPAYDKASHIFEALNNTIIPVDVDDKGINVDTLEHTDADIVYVTPSHQFPTGIVMPIKRRLELLRWAAHNEKYIIEDDYDSEFRYIGRPIPSLNSVDINERVIYIGTLSRCIAPAIRMSYMVLPEKLLKIFDKKYNHFSSTVSRIDQMIVKEFIDCGHFERHLNKMRQIYKIKHDTLIESIKKMETRVEISGENSGVHIALKVLNGMNEEELISRAGKENVIIYPISKYISTATNKFENTVLLGFGGLDTLQIKEGVKKLDKAWKGE